MTMNFDIIPTTVQVYTCADGEKFNSLKEAREHTNLIKEAAIKQAAKEHMEFTLTSYLNSVGFVGRNRVQKQTIITAFLEWQQVWDGEFIEPKVVIEEVAPVVDVLSTVVVDENPFDAPASEILVDFDIVDPEKEEDTTDLTFPPEVIIPEIKGEAMEADYTIEGVDF